MSLSSTARDQSKLPSRSASSKSPDSTFACARFSIATMPARRTTFSSISALVGFVRARRVHVRAGREHRAVQQRFGRVRHRDHDVRSPNRRSTIGRAARPRMPSFALISSQNVCACVGITAARVTRGRSGARRTPLRVACALASRCRRSSPTLASSRAMNFVASPDAAPVRIWPSVFA